MRVFAGIRNLFLFFCLISLGGCTGRPTVTRDKVQEAWDDYNNPAQLDAGSVVVLADLPSAGQASKIPWADIYWPSYLGGIALRWQNGLQTPFNSLRLSEAQVRSMSPAELSALSPAEKYDIYMGRFDFPTVQAELARTHPAMPKWQGICHGWSAAAINFDEPGAVTVQGPSGISVPFASGDVKALLAYAQGVVYMPAVRALGQRCDADLTTMPHLRNTAACRDTNAGAFHLVLANLIGRNGQNLIADLTRGAEVWNFPIFAYATREISRQPASVGAAPQAVTEVIVETDVHLLVELEQPNVMPLGDNRPAAEEVQTYQYAIELDSLGRIVGGRWLSDERPDFMWLQERAAFRGYFADISRIYESSLLGTLTPAPLPTTQPVLTPTPALPPVLTPPPAPTAPPLPPVIDPSQPIGPILTQPIPVPPVAGGAPPPQTLPAPSNGATGPTFTLSCPLGTHIDFRGYAYCTDGISTFAPYTNAMLNSCLQNQMAGCRDPFWKNELYNALRGGGVCPQGSNWNEPIAACVEGSVVLGPFSAEFVDQCTKSGFGNMCFGMKLELSYYNLAVGLK
ncbi:hypothetical protein EBU99_08600 [bacterium]|nr:hypothetical protein [bacterium]